MLGSTNCRSMGSVVERSVTYLGRRKWRTGCATVEPPPAKTKYRGGTPTIKLVIGISKYILKKRGVYVWLCEFWHKLKWRWQGVFIVWSALVLRYDIMKLKAKSAKLHTKLSHLICFWWGGTPRCHRLSIWLDLILSWSPSSSKGKSDNVLVLVCSFVIGPTFIMAVKNVSSNRPQSHRGVGLLVSVWLVLMIDVFARWLPK